MTPAQDTPVQIGADLAITPSEFDAFEEICLIAMQILSKPRAWTRGAVARDRNGTPVSPDHFTAVKFSIMGAFTRAYLEWTTKLPQGAPPLSLSFADRIFVEGAHQWAGSNPGTFSLYEQNNNVIRDSRGACTFIRGVLRVLRGSFEPKPKPTPTKRSKSRPKTRPKTRGSGGTAPLAQSRRRA